MAFSLWRRPWQKADVCHCYIMQSLCAYTKKYTHCSWGCSTITFVIISFSQLVILFLLIFKTLSFPNHKSQGAEILRKCSTPPCVLCHMSCVTCHMSHVMCHMSYVMCHMSYVTCQMSHVTCHKFLNMHTTWPQQKFTLLSSVRCVDARHYKGRLKKTPLNL